MNENRETKKALPLHEPFIDMSLVCIDCGLPFVFEAGEQRYFFAHKLAFPRRCQACRFLKKRDEVQNGSS